MAIVLVLGALIALGPLSIDMYLPSLPVMQRELHTSASLTQLTLAVYFAGLGLGQLVYGPLTDRFGRKPPLYAGLAVYVLASIACALAPSVHALVALRFAQALGGAAGQVISRAVVRDLHVGAKAARMLAMLTLVMGIAPIVAPLVGGWILLVAGWRAIFAALAALGLGTLVLMIVSLPETATTRSQRIDLGMIRANLREIMRDRSFVAFTLAGAFAQAGMFAYISGSPFVFIELFHVSPQAYGWIFGANAFGLIAASQVNHWLLERRTPARLLVWSSMAIAAIGMALLVVAMTGLGGLPSILASLFAYITSVGLIGSNAVALAMDGQGARAGLASAVLGFLQFAIAAVASSLVGVLNDGSARPMGGVMAACAVACWLTTSLCQRSAGADREHLQRTG
jgi:DHA1 family bicyclomycin/chloramphenicol resistance-like MFS transporter